MCRARFKKSFKTQPSGCLATSVHSGTAWVLCRDESWVLSCSGCNEEQEFSFFDHIHEMLKTTFATPVFFFSHCSHLCPFDQSPSLYKQLQNKNSTNTSPLSCVTFIILNWFLLQANGWNSKFSTGLHSWVCPLPHNPNSNFVLATAAPAELLF